MKSFEYRTKPHQRTQQTQTDFSSLSLLEKLRQKDQQIQKLQKELQHYKHRNLSLNDDMSKVLNQTPSNSSLKKEAELKGSKLFNSNKFDSKVKTIHKLPGKLPLDTANIEEFDNFIIKNRSSNDTPEPVQVKAFTKYPRKKSSDRSNLKIPYSKNSKLSLKAKQKLNKNTSIISELVYQDSQDIDAWNNLLNKFREDPGLIKQALDFKDEKRGNSVSVEPVQVRTRVASAYKTRKLSQEINSEYRPLSAVKGNFRPVTAKVKEIDWSKSVLDDLVAKGNSDFASGEFYYCNSQVEELMMNKNYEKLDMVFEKGCRTLEKLKTELLLPKNFMIAAGKSDEGLEKVFKDCSSLFRARALVVKILKLIHQREDVMLKLIASEEADIEKDFQIMEKLGQEILQIITFLKHSKFPINTFTYLGEDYGIKIQRDLESILSLYPKLKVKGIFDDYNM